MDRKHQELRCQMSSIAPVQGVRERHFLAAVLRFLVPFLPLAPLAFAEEPFPIRDPSQIVPNNNVIYSEHGADVTVRVRREYRESHLDEAGAIWQRAGGQLKVRLMNPQTRETFEVSRIELDSIQLRRLYAKGENFETPAGEWALVIEGQYGEPGPTVHPSGGQSYAPIDYYDLVPVSVSVRLKDPPISEPRPPADPTPRPPEAPQGGTSINAVIITERSNPWSAVQGTMRLRGGVIALGWESVPAVANTASTARIAPDNDLLTGQKIPPITPNLIDIRISRHSSSARIGSAPESE
jgi:hypothetical protein